MARVGCAGEPQESRPFSSTRTARRAWSTASAGAGAPRGGGRRRAAGGGSAAGAAGQPLFGVGIDQASGESGRAGGAPAGSARDGGPGGVDDSERVPRVRTAPGPLRMKSCEKAGQLPSRRCLPARQTRSPPALRRGCWPSGSRWASVSGGCYATRASASRRGGRRKSAANCFVLRPPSRDPGSGLDALYRRTAEPGQRSVAPSLLDRVAQHSAAGLAGPRPRNCAPRDPCDRRSQRRSRDRNGRRHGSRHGN